MDALQPGATRHDGGLDVVLEAVASLRGTVRDPDTGLPVVAAAVVAVDPAGEVVAPLTLHDHRGRTVAHARTDA